jgi:peptidoglycan hydrolase-like protein with peptidoglycan-binding domain
VAAQRPADSAIPVAERFDPVVGSYRPAVLEPLSAVAVQALQQALVESGDSPGPVTGVVETRTRAALRDFQAAHGLRLTGRPDYDTVLALGLPVRPATADDLSHRPPSARPYDVVIIGPPDSLGPALDGVGAMPGGRDDAPPVSGPGADPAPDPGVPPVPDPGVEPVPDPGVPATPAPGAAPGAEPGTIVLPPSPASLERDVESPDPPSARSL